MATEIIDLEVKSNIQFASDHAAALAENLKKATQETKDLDDANKKSKKGWIATNLSAKALGASLKAMGIGLIVAAIAALSAAFYRNEKVAAELGKVMNTVSNAAADVVDVFVETAVWVSESSARFNGLAKVLGGMITIQLTPLKLAFYGIKLAIQNLMLQWEASPLGGGDAGKIKELQEGMKQTARDILDVGKSAVQAGKDIYNNIGDAIGEVNDIYNILENSTSKIRLDNTKRGEEATQAAKDEMTDLEKFILALNERTAQAEADSDEKKIERERDKHIAELDKLKVNAEEKAILKEQLDKLYDDRLTEIRVEREKTEAEALAELEQQNALTAEENIWKRAQAELDIQKKKEELALEGHENFEQLKIQIDEKYTKKSEKLNEAKVKAAKASSLEQAAAFGGLSKTLGGIFDDNKELAVASAIIDTYVGANKAFAQGGVAGYVTAAGVIAAGLANVNTIYATGDSGGGGGGGASAMPPAPQMMSGAFELSGGQEVEPARAYVVSDDITNNQNKLAIIRRRATI